MENGTPDSLADSLPPPPKKLTVFDRRNRTDSVRGMKLFQRWRKKYFAQRDMEAGATYDDVMKKYGWGSRATVARVKKVKIPDWVVEFIQHGDTSGPQKEIEAAKAREGTNLQLNPVEFCEDPEHLNLKLFPMQKLILKCFYGLPLSADEEARVKDLVAKGKCTWKGLREYRELVLVVGMKGSKTTLAGAIACIQEYKLYQLEDFREHYGLPKDKKVFILNVATNEEQARQTIFAETQSIVRNSPYYKRRMYNEVTTSFSFDNNVIIQSGHSNSSALVGPLCFLVQMDELDRFTTKKDGRSSGKRMYSSISRNVTPFQMDGRVVSISSPMHVSGPIMNLFEKSKAEPTMLGFWLPTWEMNPNLPFDSPVLQAELRKSPEDFWRDYGAQPARAMEKYYRDRVKIDDIFERAIKRGMKNPVRSDGTFRDDFVGNPMMNYHLHMDPSVRNDCFGIALAHAEGPWVIADMVHRFKPAEGELDYEEIKQFLILLAERFPTIQTATYDVYLAVSLSQALEKKLGIDSEYLLIDKSIHDKLKIEAIYTGRLICHPHRYLKTELRDLELINGKKVDHPDENEEGGKGSKDTVDALAGAVAACLGDGMTESLPISVDEDEGSEQTEMGGSRPTSVTGPDESEGGGSLIW